MSERINIKWRPGLASGQKNRVRQDRGLRRVPGYELIEAELGWEVCELPPGLAHKEIGWLMNHPNVEAVETEGFGSLIQPVNVEVIGPLGEVGAMLSVTEGAEWWQRFVKAPEAWAVTKGTGAIVGICDNGLGPHWFTDKGLVETRIFDLAETDAGGGSHGNPVTGCDFGIAPQSSFTNYKIAGTDVRCSWNDVSNAFLHARAMGRKVLILSWGGGSSLLLQDTCIKLRADQIAVVVAAGNSGDGTQFPARLPSVYAVSALDEAGNIAGFSCRGKIDIAAPGVNLLTTTSGGGWAHFSGTSGAAPIIGGLGALVLSKNPTWTGVQAMEHLLATATPKLPATDYGAGLPNAAKALGAEETAPPPVDPPPPEPPPAPPPDQLVRLSDYATASIDPPDISPANETIAHGVDGVTGTKCLIFNAAGYVTFRFTRAADPQEVDITSANDYPVRDPRHVIVTAVLASGAREKLAQVNIAFVARFQTVRVPLARASAAVVALEVYMQSSVEWTPGDRGTGILQFAELHPWGYLADPPPPAEETWTPKSATTVDRSLYAPTEAVQTCTVMTITTAWEESNLGNKRNETSTTVTVTENRTVTLPNT